MIALPDNDTLFICTYDNLQPFLTYFDDKGIHWREIARQYHIPEHSLDSGHWLPTRNTLAFLAKLFLSTTEPVGINVGESLTLSHFPQLDKALKDVYCLEKAVDIYVEISQSAFSSHLHIWTEKYQNQWLLCHRSAFPSTMPGFNQIEWYRTLGLLTLCRHYLGANWQPETLWMSMPQYLALSCPEALKHTDIIFGQPFGGIPLPFAEDYEPMQNHLERFDWLTKVKALITTYATLPRFSVFWFSQMIGMSSRTLQRRLREQGTSLSRLRGIARCEKAKLLLTSTDLPVLEVGHLCGYTDLSNFNRAFRSWSGMTAPQYRHSLAST
ncbi:helix-turn-helix transcriptional regulator [Endozoicomonas lisbonensis]|uniref:AraC-like DNA-binding protein n=1 Tax=Endozoicomonas lisbonensis TaxID=3120522 RepID=A0ABV2SDW3_9GAMM